MQRGLREKVDREMTIQHIDRPLIEGSLIVPCKKRTITFLYSASILFFRLGIVFGAPKGFFGLHKVAQPSVAPLEGKRHGSSAGEFQKLSKLARCLHSQFEVEVPSRDGQARKIGTDYFVQQSSRLLVLSKLKLQPCDVVSDRGKCRR